MGGLGTKFIFFKILFGCFFKFLIGVDFLSSSSIINGVLLIYFFFAFFFMFGFCLLFVFIIELLLSLFLSLSSPFLLSSCLSLFCTVFVCLFLMWTFCLVIFEPNSNSLFKISSINLLGFFLLSIFFF